MFTVIYQVTKPANYTVLLGDPDHFGQWWDGNPAHLSPWSLKSELIGSKDDLDKLPGETRAAIAADASTGIEDAKDLHEYLWPFANSISAGIADDGSIDLWVDGR